MLRSAIDRYSILKTLGVTKTRFITVCIPASAVDKGFPIGRGKCKAVVLQLNTIVYNSILGSGIPTAERIVYYGDANQQKQELSIFTEMNISDLIICDDLNDVWIKGIPNTANKVQVIIYE